MLGLKELLHFLPMGHITLISNVIDEWKSRKSKYTYSVNSPFKLNPPCLLRVIAKPLDQTTQYWSYYQAGGVGGKLSEEK